MRTRFILLCLIAFSAICLLLWLWQPNSSETKLGEPASRTVHQSSPTDQNRSTDEDQVLRAATTLSNRAELSAQEIVDRRFDEWRVPINFYGKVVDEARNPVPGASVNFGWTDLSPEGYSHASMTSDTEGLFALEGKSGKHLSVGVSKEGYYTSRRNRNSFFYSGENENFVPDNNSPIVFELRKRGQGAELITSEKGARLNVAVRVPKNNEPVRVDFYQKQASATGQLEINQNKPPWREATNWSFRLSIPDGGFVENDDEFQFEAPETNYRPTVEYHFARPGTNWATQVTKTFYIAFGQPLKYGWLRIESNLAQETIFLTYAINPSGSRNLEPAN